MPELIPGIHYLTHYAHIRRLEFWLFPNGQLRQRVVLIYPYLAIYTLA